MKLFAAQFIILMEEISFSAEDRRPIIIDKREYIDCLIFAADNAEEAYVLANKMSSGMGDANCDGPDDRTDYTCLGLYELEEILSDIAGIGAALREPYGIEVATLGYDRMPPKPRTREQLSVFRNP